MPGDMKFEESSLTRYLVKNLEPLTEADPVILAEYVATLLKKDKPTKELQRLCTENLVEFLGHDTKSFITKLFQALEDGFALSNNERSDRVKQAEPSPVLTTADPVGQESLSPKLEKFSPSGPVTDPEEKEISDDDDDDRNHKHRRRETQSMSSDKDAQEQIFRRPNKKRDQPFENGQLFLGNDPQSIKIRKEYDLGPLEGVKFEKWHAGLAPLSRTPLDLGYRTRVSQKIHSDTGPRFDVSTSLGRFPIGRGRGRNSGSWNHHDSRFSSVDRLDFSSQMAPQGSIPPSLYAGRGIPDAAAQSGSWGAFGLIHGMPNGGLDTLHPLGLQGTLRPTINPLNIGIPHQRCRDFEERGYCLRGDMCPMEHGVNRIVVDDVQSLSQFNLPVSIQSGRLLGVHGGTGALPPGSAPSNTLTNGKGLHGKISKSEVSDDGVGLNGTFPGSVESVEADLYDPDQPLWSNDHPGASGTLLRLPSPKLEDTEQLWAADSSDRQSFKIAIGSDSERLSRSLPAAVGSQSTSVWGRIGNSGNRLEVEGKIDSTVSATGNVGNEMEEDQEEKLSNIHGSSLQGKRATRDEVSPKAKNFSSTSKLRPDSRRNVGRKALRTLFVNGIPLANNKKESLISHFKKFGEVIDIYIPVNSERAFVQFSKKEEAEAALMAPDAVMGNRFIKLWWANRDNIPDGGESSGNVANVSSHGTITSSFATHPSVEVGKENNQSAAVKLSTAPISDATTLSTIPPRSAVTNGSKATTSQKKLETLELLEELRKKQEMLDQKRNDFRRQLDRLEKQAITVNSEDASEQPVKRHRTEPETDVAISSTPRRMNPVPMGARPDAEKTPNRSPSGENIALSSAKLNPIILQQSPRSVKQPNLLPSLNGSPFLVNRFKLDNRPTSFRILPPLPTDIANVSALKEHFSSFGDLSSVELEDHEDNDGNSGLKTSQKFSARITFTARHTAERAFLYGKCCQGHNLHFTWLATSSNSSTNHKSGEISPAPKRPLDVEIPVGDSSSKGKLMYTPSSQEAATTRNKEPERVDGMEGNAECMLEDLVEVCPTYSLSGKQPPESDVPITRDDLNIGNSE